RTASVSNARSRARSGSATGNGQAFDPNGRGVHAVAESQIVGGGQRLEDVEQVTRDGNLADRVTDLSVLDPEPAGAATVVARHAVDAAADQVGDVEAVLDVRDQRFWAIPARLHIKIVGAR